MLRDCCPALAWQGCCQGALFALQCAAEESAAWSCWSCWHVCRCVMHAMRQRLERTCLPMSAALAVAMILRRELAAVAACSFFKLSATLVPACMRSIQLAGHALSMRKLPCGMKSACTRIPLCGSTGSTAHLLLCGGSKLLLSLHRCSACTSLCVWALLPPALRHEHTTSTSASLDARRQQHHCCGRGYRPFRKQDRVAGQRHVPALVCISTRCDEGWGPDLM